MNDRRLFLGGLLGSAVGGYTADLLGVVVTKEIVTDPADVLLVFHIESTAEEDLVRVQERLTKLLNGYRVVVLPNGVEVTAIPAAGMVYHRERLGEVEVEIIAKTEEDLRQRLALVLGEGAAK